MYQSLKLSLFALMLLSIGCQRTASIDPNAYVPTQQTGTTIVNNLCSDGTLSCIPEAGPGIFTDDASARESLYQSCMIACCHVSPFSSINSGNCPGPNADMTYNMCNSNSRCGDILNSTEPLYPSDELRIPDNAKAIKVQIDACYGKGVLNVVKFDGPLFNFVHQRTTTTQTQTALLSGGSVGALGDPVGKAIECGLEGLHNKVKVTYKQVTDASVSYGRQSQTVIPFSNTTEIPERKYSAPNIVLMGIPYELRQELNMQQHSWILDYVELLGPISADLGDTGVMLQHISLDAPPTTLVNITESPRAMPIRLHMVFFAQDAAAAQ